MKTFQTYLLTAGRKERLSSIEAKSLKEALTLVGNRFQENYPTAQVPDIEPVSNQAICGKVLFAGHTVVVEDTAAMAYEAAQIRHALQPKPS